MEKVPSNYDALLSAYQLLKKELNEKNQEIYDTKRRLKVSEALQLEYQSEIELIQAEVTKGSSKFESRVIQLEGELVKCRATYNEHISHLEQRLSDKEAECIALTEKNDLLKKSNVVSVEPDDQGKLLEKNLQLKTENEELLFIVEELKMNLETNQEKCSNFEEKIHALQSELDEVKQSLQCKREEIMESNDLVQQLNQEIFNLKTEMDTLKSKPLNEKSQGNSLFAEVDDRRVHLQKTINMMKKDYEDMRKNRKTLINQVEQLSIENTRLCEQFEKEISERRNDESNVIMSLNSQIATLTKQIEQYKKDLQEKLPRVDQFNLSNMYYYVDLVKKKTEEIVTLRDEITFRGLSITMLTENIAECNKEIRQLRIKTSKLECEIRVLNNKLVEITGEGKIMKQIKADIVAEQKNIDEIIKNQTIEREPELVPQERYANFELKSVLKKENMYEMPNSKISNMEKYLGSSINGPRQRGLTFNFSYTDDNTNINKDKDSERLKMNAVPDPSSIDIDPNNTESKYVDILNKKSASEDDQINQSESNNSTENRISIKEETFSNKVVSLEPDVKSSEEKHLNKTKYLNDKGLEDNVADTTKKTCTIEIFENSVLMENSSNPENHSQPQVKSTVETIEDTKKHKILTKGVEKTEKPISKIEIFEDSIVVKDNINDSKVQVKSTVEITEDTKKLKILTDDEKIKKPISKIEIFEDSIVDKDSQIAKITPGGSQDKIIDVDADENTAAIEGDKSVILLDVVEEEKENCIKNSNSITKKSHLPKLVTTKKVTFSENTEEPAETNRKLLRKGARTLKVQTVFFPSKPS